MELCSDQNDLEFAIHVTYLPFTKQNSVFRVWNLTNVPETVRKNTIQRATNTKQQHKFSLLFYLLQYPFSLVSPTKLGFYQALDFCLQLYE